MLGILSKKLLKKHKFDNYRHDIKQLNCNAG
jgi:hypothetical protein